MPSFRATLLSVLPATFLPAPVLRPPGRAWRGRWLPVLLGMVLGTGWLRAAESPASVIRFDLRVTKPIGWFVRARLLVRAPSSGEAVAVEFRRGGMRLYHLPAGAGGGERLLWRGKVRLDPGTHRLILRATGREVRLCLDQTELTVRNLVLRGRLRAAFQTGDGLEAAGKPRVQRAGRIMLADDFSRTVDNAAIWEGIGGRFGVNASRDPGASQDAFQYWGRAPGGRGIALAAQSRWFWADYRMGVAAKTSQLPSTWGMVFHYVDPGTYHAVRWRQPADGPGTIQLLRRRNGRDVPLAERALSLHPGQWDRADVLTAGTSVRVYVNGTLVLEGEDPALTGGRAGLLVEGGSSVSFDDVRIESIPGLPGPGQALSRPFGPHEQSWSDFSKKSFFDDPFMVQWAHPRALWHAEGVASGTARMFRTRCFRDVRFAWEKAGASSCQWPGRAVRVGLFTAPGKPDSGYAFVLRAEKLELRREGRLVASSPLEAKALTALECRIDDGQVSCRINGEDALTWEDSDPIRQGYVWADLGPVHGLGGRGLRQPDWRDSAHVTSTHRLDYNFDFAPAAWRLHSGAWQSTNRWACVPLWSFFAGRGARGAPGIEYENCLLWCRRRFAGDFDMELFISPLEGSPQRVHFSYPVTLNVAFAADGEQLDSGYMLLFGTYDLPTRLYSGGKLLAESSERIIPQLRRNPRVCYSRLTQPWQHLRIERRGAHVTVQIARHDDRGNYLGLQEVFSVDDPDPPRGDRLGLWTWGANGLALARVSVSYAESAGVQSGDPAAADARRSSVRSVAQTRRGEPVAHFRRVANAQPGGAFCYDLPGRGRVLSDGDVLDFDFRAGQEPLALSLQASIRGQVAEYSLRGDPVRRDRTIPLGTAFAGEPPESGTWGHVRLPLGRALREVFATGPLVLDRLVIASPYETIEQIAGLGVNHQGARYDIANLKWSAPLTAPPAPPAGLRLRIRGIDPLDDFEYDTAAWRTLGGWDGAAIHRDREGAPEGGGNCLRLLNRRIAGPAGAWAVETAYNASAFPALAFRYRMPPDIELNLLVKANGRWHEIQATGLDNLWPLIGSVPGFRADSRWHEARVDLYGLLRSRLGTPRIRVEALAWGDTFRMSSSQATAWRVDDFCRVPAVPAGSGLEVGLEGLDGRAVTAYSHLLDDQPRTVPPEQPTGQGAVLRLQSPLAGHTLHVRGRLADGRWSSARHLPLAEGKFVELAPLSPKSPAPDGPPPAPYISYVPSDRLCRNEFEWSRTPEFPEQHQGEVAVRRSAWVLLTGGDGATGNGSIDIMTINGQEVFSGYLRKSRWKPRRWPKVAFDYKFPQTGTALTLTLLTGGALAVVEWTGSVGNNAYYRHKRVRAAVVGNIGPAVQDDRWHHVEFDLGKMLGKTFYAGDELPEGLQVREFGTWACSPNPQSRGTFSNPPGARVRIDNFTLFSERGDDPAFEWSLHGYSKQPSGYSYSWNRNPETLPPETIRTPAPRAEFRDVEAGVWYFHVRARGPDGKWGEASHRRVVIEP